MSDNSTWPPRDGCRSSSPSSAAAFSPPSMQNLPAQHPFIHRISNLSEVSYPDTYPAYDAVAGNRAGLTSPPPRGRESLVSMRSEYHPSSGAPPLSHAAASTRVAATSTNTGYASQTVTLPAPSWAAGFSPTAIAGGYEQLPAIPNGYAQAAPPQRAPSRTARLAHHFSILRSHGPPIVEEEEIGMSLIKSPAAMGHFPPASPPEEEMTVDVTATLGPMALPADEQFLKSMQEQEARGTLTGGLGRGLGTGTRIRDQELLSGQPQQAGGGGGGMSLARTISRSMPRSGSKLSRADTIKGLGQDEANRRGEIIEVVIEEEEEEEEWGGGGTEGRPERSTVDLSFMVAPRAATFGPGGRARKERQHTQIFYPKGDWKPFSMRAPYLVFLIVLSFVLAVSQEILYHRFHKEPMFKFRSPDDLGSGNYFAVKFAPTIVSVTYGVLWQFADFEVMRLEAFYQLSREGGALAGESINVDYVTEYNLLRPVRALRLRHHAVAVSSVATTLAVSLVPTFSAASIFLSPDRQTRLADPDMLKTIHVREVWSRLLSVTLLLCAVLGAVLLFLLQSRRSGLLADVRGIAGLAAMAVASHVLTDFRDTDTARPKDIHHKLRHRRYVLRNASLAPDDENPVSDRDRDRLGEVHVDDNPHPLMLRPVGCVSFIAGLLLFAAFVPTFLFSPAGAVTEHAPFVVTALAVCIKLGWGALETSVRMMEPYYILSKRHAPPRTLTLDYTAVPFGYLPVRAFFNRHPVVFLVGFGTVMTEALTILVTSLSTVDGRDFLGSAIGDTPDDDPDEAGIRAGQETMASFLVTFVLVMFILLYMFVVATVVFVRRRHPFLPRQPSTISSILAFIHQSRMLYDFVDTARLSNAEMVRHVAAKGKTYGLGWYTGRDGRMHCGVDQEELMSSYKHGIDFAQGNMPWNTNWDHL